jgi:hypothetical protein
MTKAKIDELNNTLESLLRAVDAGNPTFARTASQNAVTQLVELLTELQQQLDRLDVRAAKPQ